MKSWFGKETCHKPRTFKVGEIAAGDWTGFDEPKPAMSEEMERKIKWAV